MQSTKSRLEQLGMILNHLDMAVCLVDKNADLQYWNDKYLQMTQCDSESLMRDYGNMRDVVNQGKLNHSFALEVLDTKKKCGGCQKIIDANGQIHYHYAVHYPIFDANGDVEYSLAIVQDISKLRSDYLKAVETLDNNITMSLFQPIENDEEIIYNSSSMERLLNDMVVIARTDASILIQGESGTGKDLFAKFIHSHSPNASGKLVPVNCASIPADLFESELFGYSGGSFTGALSTGKRGLVEDADGGTLFLDEINSMPITMQSKLLRVLEQKTVKRVGSTEEKPVNFRLISATNVDLMDCVKKGTFRLDLFFRLNVMAMTIPPLRERPDDIPVLVSHFADYYGKLYNREISFSDDVIEQLKEYAWPGNIRELKNLIERVILMSGSTNGAITSIADYFFYNDYEIYSKNIQSQKPDSDFLIEHLTFDENLEYYEKRILKEATRKYKNLKEVEEKLDISHATLYRKLSKYDIKV